MSGALSITQTQVFTALSGVLATFGLASSTIGQAVPIIRGQVNRVPEPDGTDFVVMWPIARDRITTNIDRVADIIVTGSIASDVLTVSAVAGGTLIAAQIVYYMIEGVPHQIAIVRQLTGTPGAAGTYAVDGTPDYAGPTLYAGTLAAQVPTELTMQLDVHGPASADNAQRVTTLMRDWYAVQAFLDIGYGVAPLYTSDPKQIPFDNGEQQVEERWVVECCLQVNPIVTVTQQFADQLETTTIEIEASYP